ncbi:uncharacterized protein LOC112602568 [Melanaphis sacchari]|uniref:uncharacterized protein LOC112602568 n=1 Tax=Melanaphis sacchari TaxID=742174 RepID=UPI000DC13C15|nr:uncharacterized protein LOC112602568 [Melanaphis sacchari]
MMINNNNNSNKLLAYRPIVLFWRTFGVFPVNTLDENRKSDASLPILSTLLLLASCVYVLFVGPAVVCRFGDKCSNQSIRVLKDMYPKIVNVTSMLSRIALSYSVTARFDKYRETMGCYETYSPTTVAEVGRYRVFTAAAVSACLLLVLPVNVLRLCMLWTPDGRDPAPMQGIAFYAFIYVQNVTMCCSETQFAEQCFALYSKIKAVNDDVAVLGRSAGLARSPRRSGRGNAAGTAPDAPAGGVAAAVDAVESLRIRHWLLREAIGCLNHIFGVQLGMSVCALCVMTFFDIYYETFHVMGKYAMSDLIFYCWMLHYAVRYVGIILMSHYTTKQAIYTKTLIANLKSNCLDYSINQELHLFLDQLSHSSVEFTACDVFTLNIRLIISTFAAGLTYLVILIQYQTNIKNST